jgi:hypothetical protein
VAPFFEKAGLINDQHRVRVSQMLHEVTAQLVTHRIRVPERAPQHGLEAIGGGFPADFGQLPAVLALGGTEQAPQIRHRPLPGLGARERGPQPALDIGQVGRSTLDRRDILVPRESSSFL